MNRFDHEPGKQTWDRFDWFDIESGAESILGEILPVRVADAAICGKAAPSKTRCLAVSLRWEVT